MRLFLGLICLAMMFCLGACTTTTSGSDAYGGYKGKGGMTVKKIKPEVYAYHYDYGFTGPDAMGWDPNLQYAWSRTGAAQACKVPVNEDKVLTKMVAVYGHDKEFTHKINGVTFHRAHAAMLGPDFCTPERVEELKTVIPQFEAGNFPKKF